MLAHGGCSACRSAAGAAVAQYKWRTCRSPRFYLHIRSRASFFRAVITVASCSGVRPGIVRTEGSTAVAASLLQRRGNSGNCRRSPHLSRSAGCRAKGALPISLTLLSVADTAPTLCWKFVVVAVTCGLSRLLCSGVFTLHTQVKAIAASWRLLIAAACFSLFVEAVRVTARIPGLDQLLSWYSWATWWSTTTYADLSKYFSSLFCYVS